MPNANIGTLKAIKRAGKEAKRAKTSVNIACTLFSFQHLSPLDFSNPHENTDFLDMSRHPPTPPLDPPSNFPEAACSVTGARYDVLDHLDLSLQNFDCLESGVLTYEVYEIPPPPQFLISLLLAAFFNKAY